MEQISASVPIVTAGSTAWISSSIAKSGYTPVGIVGWYFTGGVSNSNLFPYSMRVNKSASTLSVAVRNMSATNATEVSMTAEVLYEKA